MTLKLYLAGIIFTTILAFVSFFLLIGFFPPQDADVFLLGVIFFSLFVGLCGLFSLAGFFVRKRRNKKEAPFRFLSVSFREGAFLAFLLTGSLILRTYDIFWWWSGLFLLILVLAGEIFFLRRQE